MSEVIEQQQEEVQVSEEQQESTAFEAGFQQVAGDAPAEEPEVQAAPVEAPQAEAKNPEEEPFLDGLTKAQVKALLAKASEVDSLKSQMEQERQRLFGKIGEVQRYVNELKQAKPSEGAMKAASGTKLNKLREQFPELAELLEADLTVEPGQAVAPQQQIDPKVIEEIAERRAAAKAAELERKMEEKRLSSLYKGWKEDINSPDFRLWLQTQPKEYQQKLVTSRDSDEVADGLTQFKAWRDKGAKQQANRQRLEAAVTPAGANVAATAEPSEWDGFLAGFNAVRKGR